MRPAKPLLGLSLIELLYVLAIAALLTSLAHANYSQVMLKMKREEAKAALMEIHLNYARYFLTHLSYESAIIGEGELAIYTNEFTRDDDYRLELTKQSAEGYLLTAIPASALTQNDQTCASFTLTHLGEQGISGTGSAEQCWNN